MAVLHRFVLLEAVGLHSRQRIALPFSADRFRFMGAALLPDVIDSAHLPPNGVILEVEPSEASSQVPAGFYKLPEEFARRDLKEITEWLLGC